MRVSVPDDDSSHPALSIRDGILPGLPLGTFGRAWGLVERGDGASQRPGLEQRPSERSRADGGRRGPYVRGQHLHADDSSVPDLAQCRSELAEG